MPFGKDAGTLNALIEDALSSPVHQANMAKARLTPAWLRSRLKQKQAVFWDGASKAIMTHDDAELALEMRKKELRESLPRTRFESFVVAAAPFSIVALLTLTVASILYGVFDIGQGAVEWLKKATGFGIVPIGVAAFIATFVLIGLAKRKAESYSKKRAEYLGNATEQKDIEEKQKNLEKFRSAINDRLTEVISEELRQEIDQQIAPSYATTLQIGEVPGLSEIFNSTYEVITPSHERLNSIVHRVPGGSIGIAGPRGSGKSTLMASYCDRRELQGEKVLAVLTSAPVQYEARDFILHLFSRVCRRVLEADGRTESTPTWESILEKMRHDAHSSMVGTLIPAAVRVCAWIGLSLVALAFFTALVTLEASLSPAAQIDTKAGVSRPSSAPGKPAQPAEKSGAPASEEAPNRLNSAQGASLLLKSLGLTPEVPFKFGLLLVLIAFMLGYGAVVVEVERNPKRSGSGIVLRVLNMMLGDWAARLLRSPKRPRTLEPTSPSAKELPGEMEPAGPLARSASHWLQEIRFQQSFTSGWSGALKIPLGVEGGLTGAMTLSQKQLSMPEITEGFVDFLKEIAGERKVFIGIDELDKLDDERKAVSFVNDIKGVFGIPRVYYLVSVSENAMSAFERRGLPFRDAFDSSFDDVVHVDYLNFEASRSLLARRVVGLPVPFSGLCHCMSGGLPRDLIRMCRNMVRAVEDSPQKSDISEISTRVVADDLRGKVSAMRYSADKIQLEPERGKLLSHLYGMDAELDAATLLKCAEETAGLPRKTKVKREPSEEIARQHEAFLNLVGELSSYLYLLATVSSVFGSKDSKAFEGARSRKVFDELARVRQALAIDHGVARELLGVLRKKEGLPVPNIAHIAPLRSRSKNGHGRTVRAGTA